MSEDRTQAPSARTRSVARERGIVPRCGELTAAVGLLAAASLLGIWGKPLGNGLRSAVVQSSRNPSIGVTPAEVSASLTRIFEPIVPPFMGIVLGTAIAMILAHQLQVRGYWSPALILPDPQRLWGAFGGRGFGERAIRGVWSSARAAALAAAAIGVVLSRRDQIAALALSDFSTAIGSAFEIVWRVSIALAAASLILGLADYALQVWRVEARLRQSPEEFREDQKAVDGDPAVKARRLRLARTWRVDSVHAILGASAIVTGNGDLTVVLAGSPASRVTIRAVATGAAGRRLSESARGRGVAAVHEPALARKLARRPPHPVPLPQSVLKDLKEIWKDQPDK
jgi:flagellar biosynthetic protein FlhB